MLKRFVNRLQNGNLPDSRAIAREISRTYYSINNETSHNDSGVDVFSQDWDNLIILDACRYDTFARHADQFAGTLEWRSSRGSQTREWVRANFSNRKLHDVVYVTANGNLAHIQEEIGSELHDHIGVWQDEYRGGKGNTIAYPKTVSKAAQDANEKYPNKRLLIHYVQPHYPFIGATGEKYFDPTSNLKDIPKEYNLSSGLVPRAYEENLEVALEEVEKLLPGLTGKTVVSADHGELLGDRVFPTPIRDYGHPNGVYMEELVKVPWFVTEHDGRKKITEENPVKTHEYNDEAVEQQLRDLGYAM